MNYHRSREPDEPFGEDDVEVITSHLKRDLLDEIAGTRAGGRIRNFYAEGKSLSLGLRRMPVAVGEFSVLGQDISFSLDFIQSWLRGARLTRADLLDNPAVQRRLARRLSPVFVHEATHHAQHAWMSRHGLARYFTHDDEIEAYSNEALFMLEKAASDPAFFADIDTDDHDAADRMREDPSLFRRIVRRVYSTMPSFEAAAAFHLMLADAISEELARREKSPSAKPAAYPFAYGDLPLKTLIEKDAVSVAQVLQLPDARLRHWRDYLIRWYELSYRRVAQSRARVDEIWRGLGFGKID
jgi:hypothetical protein